MVQADHSLFLNALRIVLYLIIAEIKRQCYLKKKLKMAEQKVNNDIESP